MDDECEINEGRVRATFLGTTTFLVEDAKSQLFVDAFLSHIPARKMVPWAKVITNTGWVDQVLERIDADDGRVSDIFISHSHHDHAFDAAYLARSTNAVLHGTESTMNIGRGGLVPKELLHPCGPGQVITSGAFKITVFASKHSPCVVGGEGATIDSELTQPCHIKDYKEGHCLDFLVQHGAISMLFKSGANFLSGELATINNVDVLFLAMATLSRQTTSFQQGFVREVIKAVRPKKVVATHWNTMFRPVSEHLVFNNRIIDDTPSGLRLLRSECESLGTEFVMINGFGRLVLDPD